MHTIEKNIPFKAKSKYPFHDMEVGDSFFTTLAKSARQRATHYGIRHSMKFVSRKATSEEGEVGIRIWRVE